MHQLQKTDTLNLCRSMLRVWQNIDNEFPLQYMVCLIEIASNEGLSLSDLSTRTQMPLSTVSRIVGALSDKRQRGTPYELIRVETSATERRRKELSLTPQGRALVTDLGKSCVLM